MRTAQDLLSELNASDESPGIEAKRSREIGKSVIETVIAFANEPGLGGGYLLLGADWQVDAKGAHTIGPKVSPTRTRFKKTWLPNAPPC